MPDTTWPVGGHPPGSSRDSRYIPVSMSPVFVSTRHQRFAYARLPDPYLTHQVRLSHTVQDHGLQPRPRWAVWSLLPQGDSEGPTFISHAAPRQETRLYQAPLSVR